MVVRQREPSGSSEGVRTIVRSTAAQPGVPICLRGRDHTLPRQTEEKLREPSLLFARMAWVVVAITAPAIVVFSVPSSFEHYSSVCTAASEVCSERAVDQPTPEGVRALRDAGLSVRTYALLNVVVDKVFELVWFVVGALIFWRRSDDRMALLVSMFLVSFGPVTVDPTDAEALISSQPAWLWPVLGVIIRPGDGLILGVHRDGGS